ncbi:MAG: alpha/beta hydrolase [Burkholderiaceae bacterium]|nr:alpha/beta hydrolase [Burkholderiaceae bacterium]
MKQNQFKSVMLWLVGVCAFLLCVILIWAWAPDKNRADLEKIYATAPSAFIEVLNMRVHYRDVGPPASIKRKPQTLIFLHGFGSSLQTWDAWVAALAQDYRVVSLDLPGFGLTGANPSANYSDAFVLQFLGAFADQLGIQSAVWIGNSMGGRYAWEMAVAQPQRVDKLVLISPDGFASKGFQYGQKPSISPLLHVMRFFLPQAILEMNLKPAYANPAIMDETLAQRYYDLMLAPGVRASLLEIMRQHVLQDPRPLLGQIQAPTLLLWGERDGFIPIRNAQDYLQLMPKAKLVPLPNIGHIPQEEQPQEGLKALWQFLKS